MRARDSQITGLGIDPSCRHRIKDYIVSTWGDETMRPRAIQADVLTFQKVSLSSSVNFNSIFLLAVLTILDRVQHAALLMALSLSPKHLTTESMEEHASGWPMLPNSSKAISLSLLDLFLSSWVRVITTSWLIWTGWGSERLRSWVRRLRKEFE